MATRTNTDTGSPSTNSPNDGTGIPQKISDETMPENNAQTDQYTDDDSEIKEGVRTGHPNRNTNKVGSQNGGGYRGL